MFHRKKTPTPKCFLGDTTLHFRAAQLHTKAPKQQNKNILKNTTEWSKGQNHLQSWVWERCRRGCAALPRALHRLCSVLLRGVRSCSPPGQEVLRCPESPACLMLPRVTATWALTPTPSPFGTAAAPHQTLQVQGTAVPSHAVSPQAARDHSDASSTVQAREGIQVFKQLLF